MAENAKWDIFGWFFNQCGVKQAKMSRTEKLRLFFILKSIYLALFSTRVVYIYFRPWKCWLVPSANNGIFHILKLLRAEYYFLKKLAASFQRWSTTACVNWLVVANPPKSRVFTLCSSKTLLTAVLTWSPLSCIPKCSSILAVANKRAVGLATLRPVINKNTHSSLLVSILLKINPWKSGSGKSKNSKMAKNDNKI